MPNETRPDKMQAGRPVTKASLARMLSESAPGPDEHASSLYLRPGESLEFLKASGPNGWNWVDCLAGMGDPVLRSDTGIAGLQAGAEGLIIVPPFPLTETRLVPNWDPHPLLALLEAEYTVGVVLLRLGRFSVAVYRGDRLLSSKTDARYVKGRHAAGGTSELRFQRVREGQIRRIYDKTCEAAQSQLGPYAGDLDYLFLGGEKFTLNGFLKVCPYLERFQGITLGRRLNIRDPKRDTLEQVPAILGESRVYCFRWSNKNET